MSAEDSSGWHLARGFRYAGLHCGIRPDPERRDLAIVLSDAPASAAGVFTRNRVRAAPVRVCQERLPAADVRGLVVCSGNANACTGPQGLTDARRMTQVAAEVVACREEQFLVCSTGVIGRHLPMPVVEAGIRRIAPAAKETTDGLDALARAIQTTDTTIKIASREVMLGGCPVRLTGVAKGAAMIGPNMATMLAFVFTDAAVAPSELNALLGRVAAQTFNCVSVEGHTSTNDTLLLLANGRAGGNALKGEDLGRFGSA